MEFNLIWFIGGMVIAMVTNMLLFDKWMNLFERIEKRQKTKEVRRYE